jgi:NitT/TauT family transport system permease protein
MAGVRFGLGQAVTGMVVVELLLVASGIGYLVLLYQSRFDPGSLYATVLIVILEALVLIWAADRIAGFVAPWARHRR